MAGLLAGTAGALFALLASPSGARLEPALFQSRGAEAVRRLGAGSLLVARRDMPDPNFAETVILMVQLDEDSALGLILNRPTTVPLSRVFASFEEAKTRKDPIYEGGPVERGGVLALAKLPNRIPDATPVFGDVYLISTKPVLKRVLGQNAGPGSFRAYLGYSGWTRDQLRREVELGLWYVFPPDAAAIFDKNPDSVWERFIRRTELRVAFAGQRAVR